MRTFLHVGCGGKDKAHTAPAFAEDNWHEIRLDINDAVRPDIVGTMTDMKAVTSESVDAVFSSHNIEHLHPHEVPLALAEFLRVLKPDGFAVITRPDLQSVAALIVADKLVEAAYLSPAGPITTIDILYGHRPQLAPGNLFMAHRCGFTRKVLHNTPLHGGFKSAASLRRAENYDLWAIASKSPLSENESMSRCQLKVRSGG